MSSPRTATRLNRILTMLPWVMSHPGAKVDEVCDRFGYTRRELAADLELVFVCGLPGYGPGDLMVAYIDDDRVVVDAAEYFRDAPPLSPGEALGLLASGLTLLSSGAAIPALESAVSKLGQALLGDATDVLSVDVGEPDSMETLRSAVVDGRALDITYMALGSGKTTSRVVEPWSVFSALGNWYLSAWCRSANAERIFRVDRIRQLTVIDDTFDPPGNLPAPEIRYTPSEEDVRVTIALGPTARWVAEYYPVDVLEDTPETMIIEFSAYDPMVAAGLLLRLGPGATVVEGEEVRLALDRLRSKVLSRYETA